MIKIFKLKDNTKWSSGWRRRHSSGKPRDEENKVTTSKFPTLVFNIVRPMWQEGPIWYNHIVTVNPKRKKNIGVITQSSFEV